MDSLLFDFSVDRTNEIFDETHNAEINELKKRGRIFSSTPLHNISLGRSNLRNFSRLLSKDVAAHEIENSVTYHSEIILIHMNHNHPFLRVRVEKKRSSISTVVYHGMFFIWMDSDREPTDDLDLPFLFCTGNQRYVTVINILLQSYFSCTITPIVFSQLEFRWLFALAVHQVDVTDKNVQLVYQHGNDTRCKMDISFHHLKEWWTCIHDDDSCQINYEEVVRFHTAFEEHFMAIYGINLSHFHLKMVCIPDNVTMDVCGKVHVSKIEFSDFLFRLLSQIRLTE